MIALTSVSSPPPPAASPFERASLEAAPARQTIHGSPGPAAERSRSLEHLVVKGKGPPISSPFESMIGHDDRVRILDTDLAPWRMIAALRMKSPSGAGAIGTGWFIGPRTVITAGHCVFSNVFFGGWASEIEVIPGMNGAGHEDAARPFGSATSTRFSSLDVWIDKEDADFDIGCIHLDEPLGDAVGFFSTAAMTAEELEGFLVNIAGYPGDRGFGAEQYHARNRVVRVTDRRIFYEVDTFGGQSGAPVWVHETEDGPPIAVGIHAYGTGGTPSAFGLTANSAPRIIPEVLGQLKGWIDKDNGAVAR